MIQLVPGADAVALHVRAGAMWAVCCADMFAIHALLT